MTLSHGVCGFQAAKLAFRIGFHKASQSRNRVRVLKLQQRQLSLAFFQVREMEQCWSGIGNYGDCILRDQRCPNAPSWLPCFLVVATDAEADLSVDFETAARCCKTKARWTEWISRR